MANEMDPFEKILRDLGKMRGAAYNDLLRLPQGSLTKFALQNIDGLMSQLETDIRSIHTRVKISMEAAKPGTAERWARGLRERYGEQAGSKR